MFHSVLFSEQSQRSLLKRTEKCDSKNVQSPETFYQLCEQPGTVADSSSQKQTEKCLAPAPPWRAVLEPGLHSDGGRHHGPGHGLRGETDQEQAVEREILRSNPQTTSDVRSCRLSQFYLLLILLLSCILNFFCDEVFHEMK